MDKLTVGVGLLDVVNVQEGLGTPPPGTVKLTALIPSELLPVRLHVIVELKKLVKLDVLLGFFLVNTYTLLEYLVSVESFILIVPASTRLLEDDALKAAEADSENTVVVIGPVLGFILVITFDFTIAKTPSLYMVGAAGLLLFGLLVEVELLLLFELTSSFLQEVIKKELVRVMMDNVFNKLKVFTKRLFNNKSTKITFEEKIQDDKNINSLLVLNIFRICQEILNNAYKHSNAQEIKINIQQDNNILNITISDDGYGLKNILARAKEFNIDIQRESEVGKGTMYKLKLIV